MISFVHLVRKSSINLQKLYRNYFIVPFKLKKRKIYFKKKKETPSLICPAVFFCFYEGAYTINGFKSVFFFPQQFKKPSSYFRQHAEVQFHAKNYIRVTAVSVQNLQLWLALCHIVPKVCMEGMWFPWKCF